ncbi:MAG TPA: 23S rRNA (adenine(2503)-C(2))-methyltransferase RlmN [bacterium]|nr:23S rRNA (adenine(2503)-C(2))-methyltransferase RlmN [bacterium]
MFENIVKNNGWSTFRSKQINHAFFVELINDWSEASSLPKEVRSYLTTNVALSTIQAADTQISRRRDTIKTLFRLADGHHIESVLMMHRDRNTVCVSSQVGCPVGCLFCSTGKLGFQRNLTAREIVDQVMFFARRLNNMSQANTLPAATKSPITNVVFMGMGEPMLNLENVSAAIKILTDEQMLGLGKRKITVSTSGYTRPLKQFLSRFPHIGLAISLHAPTQTGREMIMPHVAKNNHLDELLQVCRDYSRQTKRRVSYEYILIEDINDSLEQAHQLAHILHDHLFFVNLIPYNSPGKNSTDVKKDGPFLKKPNTFRVNRFKQELIQLGVPVAVRVAMGSDIAGACGQLAGNKKKMLS